MHVSRQVTRTPQPGTYFPPLCSCVKRWWFNYCWLLTTYSIYELRAEKKNTSTIECVHGLLISVWLLLSHTHTHTHTHTHSASRAEGYFFLVITVSWNQYLEIEGKKRGATALQLPRARLQDYACLKEIFKKKVALIRQHRFMQRRVEKTHNRSAWIGTTHVAERRSANTHRWHVDIFISVFVPEKASRDTREVRG